MSKHLKPADLERLRALLVHKRDALIAAENASSADQRMIGDAETEQGDIAEKLIEQEGALRIGKFDADLLADVNRAIAKLEAGNYGVSEDSGVEIPLERLELVPWARRTAAEEEKHAKA
jgi:DnaK suppressor protein